MDDTLQPWIDRYALAVVFANEFREELGEARTMTVLARAFERLQIRDGKALAEELGGNSIETLAQEMRRRAAERDTLEIVEVTDHYIATHVTRCRSAEAFEALGAPDLCRLYCESDHAFIRAFNPHMGMVRTKSIATGDGCCNHIWVLKNGEDEREQ